MTSFFLIVGGLLLMAWSGNDALTALIGLTTLAFAGIIRTRPLSL